MPGAVIPAWTRESRRHGWQTDKAAGIGFAAETLNRHSGDSRSPESFFNFTPHPKPATLPSTNHSFASINATVIHFYTNLQPPPERTNDQSSQDDARPQRRVHRIESVASNRRIESVESIHTEIICAESSRVESIAIIHIESSCIESVESICAEIIRAEISRVESIENICAEIICVESSRVEIIESIHRNINRKQTQIKRELKQSPTPTQHRKRRALCRD